MKRRLIFSMALLAGMLLLVQNLLAQANYKHQSPIFINEKGEVSNDRGTKLGYISKEDIVFNSEGIKLGFIKQGNVYDANGKILGKAKKDGRYYNNDGLFVLRTVNNGDKCEILDPKGHILGVTHKNYKLHACVAHCFFKEEKLKEGSTK